MALFLGLTVGGNFLNQDAPTRSPTQTCLLPCNNQSRFPVSSASVEVVTASTENSISVLSHAGWFLPIAAEHTVVCSLRIALRFGFCFGHQVIFSISRCMCSHACKPFAQTVLTDTFLYPPPWNTFSISCILGSGSAFLVVFTEFVESYKLISDREVISRGGVVFVTFTGVYKLNLPHSASRCDGLSVRPPTSTPK